MKNYIFLRWSKFNHYRYISDYVSKSNLRFLVDFFSGDYRPYDKDLFVRVVSCYDANFVYNDLENKIFYIGWSEWEFDEDIEAPSREDIPNYVNESNSCKISQDNFIELAEKIMNMKKNPTPFAIVYQDDMDWVDCKGFASQEAMELFVQDHKSQVFN